MRTSNAHLAASSGDAPAPSAPDAAPLEGGSGSRPKGGLAAVRLLLVEDNAGDARLMREYLSQPGMVRFEISIVPRLSEAMDAARDHDFDVALLDLSLPDGHGLDTFTTFARETPGLPIVVLSGMDDDELALSAVREGAQDYLVKGHVTESSLARALLYAIERNRAQARLKALSVQDALTGLYNRRGFLAAAEQHLKTAARDNKATALFYADLDGMKGINDAHGHHEGDWALIKTAEILRLTFRESDIIARLGGDEFTVLAWVRSAEDIDPIQERLNAHARTINEHARRAFSLGISVGATFVPPGVLFTVEELLARADKVLYEAKRSRPTAS
jgi:diguanylate cyclase (GGDEF)-like protein